MLITKTIILSCKKKKKWTAPDRENLLQRPWNISHSCCKNDSAGGQNKAFYVVYIPRERFSFRSSGHVSMVRFEFQLTVSRKQMLLVTIRIQKTTYKTRWNFLNIN